MKESFVSQDNRFADGFKAGQNSVKRKNKSGCCCIINDDDMVESICGAHQFLIEGKSAELIRLIKRIDMMCQDHGLDCVYYKDWRAEVKKTGIKL